MGDDALVQINHLDKGELSTYQVLINEYLIDVSSITSHNISYLHVKGVDIDDQVVADPIAKPLWENTRYSSCNR